MRNLPERLGHAVLTRRWLMLVIHFGAGALLIAVALVDRTTWSAVFDLVLAGFLFGSGVHIAVSPGLMTVWHKIESQNIQAEMQTAFQAIVEQHNEQHSDDADPKRGLN